MRIPLNTLPATARYPKMVRAIIRANLSSGQNHGKGNRAKRRLGLYVHNPDHAKPFGCIAMDRGQVARMMRTAP